MFYGTPLLLIEDTRTLEAHVHQLTKAPVLGVDTESDSMYCYQEKVCLIQLSDLDNDYIIDPLAIEDVSSLRVLFEDPAITKVFHGADYDLACLRRDYDFKTTSLFDTMVASQLLGSRQLGLADLIRNAFGHTIDKQFQRHDWGKRPLRQEHLDYARGDTHFLLALREILMRKLVAMGRTEHAKEEFYRLEKRDWSPREPDPHPYLQMRGVKRLDTSGLRVLGRLYHYRDEQARQSDRPPYKVIPHKVLLEISEAKPTTLQQLDELYQGKARMKAKHGKAMVQAVVEGLQDNAPIPAMHSTEPQDPNIRVRGRSFERGFAHLRQWRNTLCQHDQTRIPATVASNGVLRNIVQYRPSSLEALAAVPEVRRWQVADFGKRILAELDRVLPVDANGELILTNTTTKPRKR